MVMLAVATDVVLIIEPHCELCRSRAVEAGIPEVRKPILLSMSPGEDGIPWFLCPACWLEGAHSRKTTIVGVLSLDGDAYDDASGPPGPPDKTPPAKPKKPRRLKS